MSDVAAGARRGRWIAGALTLVLSIPAVAAETELDAAQLRSYLALPGVHAFVPHAIPFEGSRYFLVRGSTTDGGCAFSEQLQGHVSDLSPTRRFGSVDLATRLAACEKVVERGYYAAAPVAAASSTLAQAGTVAFTPGLPRAGGAQLSRSAPLDAAALKLAAPLAAAPPLNATSVITSAGLYSEWNYGNTPALGSTGRELITGSIDSSAQIPSDICQIGGQTTWQTQYTFNPLLGYVIDTSYDNRSEQTIYCHSVCTTASCRYDWGYTENRGFYRVRNPGLLGTQGPSTVVPVCVNPITNTYAPNRIRVYTTGRYEATVNTFWSGWALGCGEFLQRFSNVHVP